MGPRLCWLPKPLASVVKQDLLTVEEEQTMIGKIFVWLLKVSPNVLLLSLLPTSGFEKQKH